jgi:hypothetical protein
MDTIAHVKVLDANLDDETYSKIVSDPNVEVQSNETLLPKTGEPILVLKYTKKEDVLPDLKSPILGF